MTGPPAPLYNKVNRLIRRAAKHRWRYVVKPEEYRTMFFFKDLAVYQTVGRVMFQLHDEIDVPLGMVHYDERHLTVTVYHTPCKHCRRSLPDHRPTNGQCLFASTTYRGLSG